MNSNVGRRCFRSKIPLEKMGIVMVHNPNTAIEWLRQPMRLSVRATLMTKPQPKDTQGDKGRYENNVQLVQWISSVYTSANDKYMETCLVQWISSEIKLRRSHHTGHNPKPYAGAYYIIRTNKGKGNINENPDITPLSMHGVLTCNVNSSFHRPTLSTQ